MLLLLHSCCMFVSPAASLCVSWPGKGRCFVVCCSLFPERHISIHLLGNSLRAVAPHLAYIHEKAINLLIFVIWYNMRQFPQIALHGLIQKASLSIPTYDRLQRCVPACVFIRLYLLLSSCSLSIPGMTFTCVYKLQPSMWLQITQCILPQTA